MTGTGSTVPGATAQGLPRRPVETVLITGASSGIGRELARLFARDGADLVFIARSEDRLRELAGELAATYGARAQVLPADLSRPASAGEIAEALARRRIQVDVLANNAVWRPRHRRRNRRRAAAGNDRGQHSGADAAESFTEALAEEVCGSGVRVCCLAPGATSTGFAARAGTLGTRLLRRGVMDAGRVARAGQ